MKIELDMSVLLEDDFIKQRVKQIAQLKKRNSYYSLNEIDKKLERYVNYNNGFYVELGANDGVSQSNTLYFELNKNWNGILIEPTLHKYFLCKANRQSKNQIFCNACVDFEFKEKYVDLKYADLMTISSNLNLDIANPVEHINSGVKWLLKSEEVINYGANPKTLNDILDFAKAPYIIDFLSLDVEGSELSVLKGINHDKYKFKFMIIEIRDFERINSFLNSHNYTFIDKFSDHDYLFGYKN